MTSSCSSDDIDQEEIQLALQAAKIATREKIRSRFHGSNDLIHRLFVCISGVADQLQTNYASDLRSILKTLFEVMATKPETEDKEKQKKVNHGLRNAALEDCALCQESISSSELAAKARDGDFEDLLMDRNFLYPKETECARENGDELHIPNQNKSQNVCKKGYPNKPDGFVLQAKSGPQATKKSTGVTTVIPVNGFNRKSESIAPIC
ncbi:hypothetical protein BTVI_136500 [Pitangus sulphuratus]|nr:hypothetical protein BTVI_136500 [Pitangus sulphuratus]